MSKTKTKDAKITKIYAIAIIGFVAVALILGATLFNSPAGAQVSEDSSVSLSLSGSALDKILCALGLCEQDNSAVGAFAGPDVYIRTNFHAGFQSGGSAYATTSALTAYTLVSSEFDQDVTYITWTTDRPTLALTTMASTSMDFVGNTTGDKRVYDFYSATTTAGATITWTAGDGVDLVEPEINGTVIQNGTDFARLTFIRKADTDVALYVEIMQIGD